MISLKISQIVGFIQHKTFFPPITQGQPNSASASLSNFSISSLDENGPNFSIKLAYFVVAFPTNLSEIFRIYFLVYWMPEEGQKYSSSD